MTNEEAEIIKFVKEHHAEYSTSVEMLGQEVTDGMIISAINDDTTPACCTRCPYSKDCGTRDIVPWLMSCEKYIKYKHTNKVEVPELTDKERIDSLERKVVELQETVKKLIAMNGEGKQ